jgi:cytochrome c peroxidase
VRRTVDILVWLGVAAMAIGLAPLPSSTPETGRRQAFSGLPASWPAPALMAGARFTAFGPLPAPPYPDDNPPSPVKAALGERLFNDPGLSASGQIACASCHNPELAFGDGLKTAFGHDRQRGRRNAPSLRAAAWRPLLFWDGRAASLETQAMAPIVDRREMAADPGDVIRRLNADPTYREAFKAAFGAKRVTQDDMARALAAYQRTLKPQASKWDRVLTRGGAVLDDQELLGLELFQGKAGCVNCHNGPLLSDGQFHNLGLSFYGRKLQDLGRYEVTGAPVDVGAFQTPSLRGVSRNGPYMHNGLFPTLEGVVNFYDAGGARPRPTAAQQADPLFPTTSPFLRPLGLTSEEKAALVAFLRTL